MTRTAHNRNSRAANIKRGLSQAFGAFVLSLWATAATAQCHLDRVVTLRLANESRLVVDVHVNGVSEFFLVDTGAEISTITPEAALLLKLSSDPSKRESITKVDGEAIQAQTVVQELSIGEVLFSRRGVAVVSMRRDAASRPLAGVIGADILRNFDVEIDVPRGTLTLFQVHDCPVSQPPWTMAYQAVPASVTPRGRIVFPVVIDGRRIAALFDTGADRIFAPRKVAVSLGVNAAALDREPSILATSGGSGSLLMSRHLFGRMRIGDAELRNVPITVGKFALQESDILVGASYMHDRRFFLSYSSHTLFIQEQRQLEPQQFILASAAQSGEKER